MTTVKFFATGGTIDKVYFDQKSEYQVGDPGVCEILRDSNVVVEYEVESLLRKDSLEITDAERERIVEKVAAEVCARVVITHGTDTMIQTALLLQRVPGKTIVLTGAMQPALFRRSDAEFNIGAALAAVQILPPGVYIAMNGRIFAPDKVRKNAALHRFEELGA